MYFRILSNALVSLNSPPDYCRARTDIIQFDTITILIYSSYILLTAQ